MYAGKTPFGSPCVTQLKYSYYPKGENGVRKGGEGEGGIREGHYLLHC